MFPSITASNDNKFSNSLIKSTTIQENYIDSIKGNNSLVPLLEFMFDFLQQSHRKIMDASKFDIHNFEPD